MAPPKRTALDANIFEDANPISKQKLAAQAHLSGRGRRNNGNVNHNNAAAFPAGSSLASLTQLANVSETAREKQSNGQPAGLGTVSVDIRYSEIRLWSTNTDLLD